ncbi:MAG: fructose bisphosphate aldolase [Heliomarina sp.]|uniref:fructose bisphosphate aldolase n=1 Tax=Heliomarina sp. TaxID=2917556 RepID=UPI004058884E
MSNSEQTQKMTSGKGFIAALDQSGGSSPKALRLYGIEEDEYSSEAEMFDLIHAMRSRIVTSSAFTGERVIGAILFEMTMDREIGGKPSAQYLWEDCGVVPFLKIDKGLADEEDGVQLMKPMPGLDELLSRAKEAGIFGTKMRSVINAASAEGIRKVVDQQFDIGEQVLKHDLVPIIEPEVTISIADKKEAEGILLDQLLRRLDELPDSFKVMLKLTLPETENLYQPLVNHNRVMRVVALSGGYSREEANERLSKNTGVIASFSRALTEGLDAKQSDEDFDATLDETIEGIYTASNSG